MPRSRPPDPERQLALPLASTSTTRVEPPAAPSPKVAPARPKTKLLEEALRAELGPVQLRITDNRSTLLSTSMRKGVRTARVHQLFLDADPALFLDLAAFLARGDKTAGRRIDAFVEARDHLLDHHVPELSPDAHVGAVHDLLAIYVELNSRYFGGAIRADITWGAASTLKRRSSITLGTYDDRSARICIHPALDQTWVPKLCVARIVHHEMLHAKYPPKKGPDGRRIVHGPQFRREEAAFTGAEEADVWFDLNLDRLLRYRPPKGAKRPPGRSR